MNTGGTKLDTGVFDADTDAVDGVACVKVAPLSVRFRRAGVACTVADCGAPMSALELAGVRVAW